MNSSILLSSQIVLHKRLEIEIFKRQARRKNPRSNLRKYGKRIASDDFSHGITVRTGGMLKSQGEYLRSWKDLDIP